jgi:hypothetical protein
MLHQNNRPSFALLTLCALVLVAILLAGHPAPALAQTSFPIIRELSGASLLATIPAPTDTPTLTATPAVTATPTPTNPPACTPTPTALPGEDTLFLHRASQDTTLSSWFPALSYGQTTQLALRSGGEMVALLQFDLGALPEGAAITFAALRISAVSGGGQWLSLSAYELLRPWTQQCASWALASAAAPWAAPGASALDLDRAAEAAATSRLYPGGSCELDLTALARKWLAQPETNFGVLLSASRDVAAQLNLASSEHWHAAKRPALVIRYTTP